MKHTYNTYWNIGDCSQKRKDKSNLIYFILLGHYQEHLRTRYKYNSYLSLPVFKRVLSLQESYLSCRAQKTCEINLYSLFYIQIRWNAEYKHILSSGIHLLTQTVPRRALRLGSVWNEGQFHKCHSNEMTFDMQANFDLNKSVLDLEGIKELRGLVIYFSANFDKYI